MKMKRCLSASILLMLSLEAALLVAGHPSDAAAVADVVGAIRLPSDTEVTAAAASRPWKCCDWALCTKSIPPICRCLSEVERCDAACKQCAPSRLHRNLFVCKDQYVGDPGPICRPWNCCDVAVCTGSIRPLSCRCVDEVEQCAPTCQTCVASTSHPSRHFCNDTYRGSPGSMCNPPPNAAGN